MTRPGPPGLAAYVIDGPTKDGPLLLRVALDQAGLWNLLAASCDVGDRLPRDLPILIKPELGAFDLRSPTATDPKLVEELIDLLHDRGYRTVALATGQESSSLWAENRDVLPLADLLGYRFRTTKGRSYEFLDLGEGLADGSFPPGALLHDTQISRAWRDSFRICFTKNRTDDAQSYALSLDTLTGVLPLPDKDYYYRHRFHAGDVVSELLLYGPPHFTIIDAVVSCHGSGGTRAPASIETNTIIASPHPLLADLAGALKMGIDPSASELFERALRSIGLPPRYTLHGNLARYPGWRNVHPLVTDSTRRRDQSPNLARTIRPWIQVSNTELFPFKTAVDAKINSTLASWTSDIDSNPSPFWSLVLTNYSLAAAHRLVTAYRVLYDKDKVRRRKVPLGLDLATLSTSDYEGIAGELRPLKSFLRSLPFDSNGLRWLYHDDAVLFEYKRSLPIPFDRFISRVDVSKTIQYMNDYLGGVAVPVARDSRGRPIHQAERNIYLPQPNYLILYEGDVIDVTKIEHITYRPTAHSMYWKTLRSENASASYDDGIVTFTRRPAATQVSIFGRQLFALPLYWQLIDLNLAPSLKNRLVTHAYTTFFNRTLANLEALVEGRDIHIGKEWHSPSATQQTETLPFEALTRSAVDLAQKYGPMLEEASWLFGRAQSEQPPSRADRNGFAHFSAPRAETRDKESPTAAALEAAWQRIATFWEELGDVVGSDIRKGAFAWRENS